MDDRELLELAARAFWGSEVDDVMSFHFDEHEGCIVYIHGDNQDHNGNDVELLWNPLTEDGDALRLATALKLSIMYGSPGCVQVSADDGGEFCTAYASEPVGSDTAAATRRAITRAAAEIGKEKSK